MTLADRLSESAGKPSGFDYLRIGLALAVFGYHCFGIAYPYESLLAYFRSPLAPITSFLVPAFFALSGFLVAGSLERCESLVSFLGLRSLRIFPALVVEIGLSAFVLGPLVTTTGLSDYFKSPQFRSYLFNVFGWVHYYLPGVFVHNAIPKVNAQLWTVPFELECYIALTLLAVVTLARRRVALLVVVILSQLAWTADQALLSHSATAYHFTDFNNVNGRSLVFSFLFGVIMYLFRDRIPWSGWLALACAAVVWLLLLDPTGSNLVGLPISYVVTYVGLTSPKRTWLVTSGDYSYGLYLFSFPIQQVIFGFGPWARHWWVMALIGLPCSFAFAAASWHLVEKHALRLRPTLKRVEAGYLRARTRVLGSSTAPARLLEGARLARGLASRRPTE